MKRKYLILTALIILLLLIFTNIFRYMQIEANPQLSRYKDRWTGIEWISVINPTGMDRIPAKYYDNRDEFEMDNNEIVRDLRRMKNIDLSLTILWCALTILDTISILYNLANINKPLINLKGSD